MLEPCPGLELCHAGPQDPTRGHPSLSSDWKALVSATCWAGRMSVSLALAYRISKLDVEPTTLSWTRLLPAQCPPSASAELLITRHGRTFAVRRAGSFEEVWEATEKTGFLMILQVNLSAFPSGKPTRTRYLWRMHSGAQSHQQDILTGLPILMPSCVLCLSPLKPC